VLFAIVSDRVLSVVRNTVEIDTLRTWSMALVLPELARVLVLFPSRRWNWRNRALPGGPPAKLKDDSMGGRVTHRVRQEHDEWGTKYR